MLAPEVAALAVAALVQAGVLVMLSARVNAHPKGRAWAASPRDRAVEPDVTTGRILRTFNNGTENLVLFTVAVVCVMLSGETGAWTRGLAWTYVAARVLYVPAYLLGWVPWRSAIWGVGFFATIALILTALF